MSAGMYTDDNGVRRPMLGTLTSDEVRITTTGAGLVAERRQRIENTTATVSKVTTATGDVSALGVAMHAGHDAGQSVPEAEAVADSGLGETMDGYLAMSGVEVEL